MFGKEIFTWYGKQFFTSPCSLLCQVRYALDNKEPYVAAKTLGECIRDRYDNYRTNKVV